jgi:hypothetical protein
MKTRVPGPSTDAPITARSNQREEFKTRARI